MKVLYLLYRFLKSILFLTNFDDCNEVIINQKSKIDNVLGRFQSGQMGQTVNLLSYDFGGSNPPLPTLISKTYLQAEVAQLVEHDPSKVRVASSSLVFRSVFLPM